jgi:nucleotide-binding universal stress UspA family protein
MTAEAGMDGGLHILFATDGSAGAALALDMLCDLPLRKADRVTVVMHPTFFLAARPNGEGLMSRLAARQRDRARAIVDVALARLIARGIRADALVQDGEDAVDAIVRAAKARAADLVVVGSRGHGAVASLVIGSTARTLAILCPVPVLVVRDRPTAPRRVLLAYDGSPAAHAALALARRLPLPDDATILAVDVIPPRVWPELGPGSDDEILDLRVRVEREDLMNAERVIAEAVSPQPGGRITAAVDNGPVAETILARARRLPADLVIVGSRGAMGPRRPFWGSTAERITVSAGCPVLIVPEPIPVETATRQGREAALAT